MSEDLSARLSRWSQRKLAARRGTPLDEPRPADQVADQVADQAKPPAANAPAAEPQAAAPAPEDMPMLPPIEELTAESDFTVFLAKNVPESIRRMALRKLWRSDPVFANLDGLVDYDENYHLEDRTISAAQTSYRVGRGYLEKIEEKLAQLEPATASDAPADSTSDHAAAAAENIESSSADAAALPRQEGCPEDEEATMEPAPDKSC